MVDNKKTNLTVDVTGVVSDGENPLMRAYIRHPSDLPIEFVSVSESNLDPADFSGDRVQDVSLGGLCFGSSKRLSVGELVRIRIPVVNPPFEADAKVIWCLARPDRYEAGIEFIDPQDAYTARMVEQICHIEHYRLWVKEVEGRELDSEDAANEWIGKYAKDFPSIA